MNFTGAYRINDENLDLRKQFIGLTPDKVAVLKKLAGWGRKVSGLIAAAFYDHQFSFDPTRTFYENYAREQGVPVTQLRIRLQGTQADYFKDIFEEARTGGEFGPAYFERRLKIGQIHNQINLPLKWYMGSYALYQNLVRRYLFKSFWYRPRFRNAAEQAIFTVFNYDMQAVSDSFFYDYLQAIGLNIHTVHVKNPAEDLSEYYSDLKYVVRTTLEKTAYTSNLVAEGGEHLSAAVDQTNQAINQIALTIQQIAHGTAQQVDSITRTGNSVGQMAHAINGVAQGAQEQAMAVTKSSAATAQMSENIQQVAQNAAAGAKSAAEAGAIAQNGAKTVAETIEGMQNIKAKVGASAQKVTEMGTRSRQIGAIVETISSIASQTNMLALNAAIEAARVGVKSHAIGEKMLDHHLTAQAQLIAELLVIGNRDWSTSFWQKLAQQTNIDTFCITDEDGVVVYCDDPTIVGFRFSTDPKDQTYEFRTLLSQSSGVVCQAAQPRGVDGQMYKYVGVSRRDRRGIVQVGFKANSLNQFRLQTGGFAVVADEVRKLAEKSAAATREIAQLVQGIQTSVSEAVQAMDTGAKEVENGVARADRAGQALAEIMKAVEAVTGQVDEIAAAAQKMQASSAQMVSAMESVSAVVEENTATTEEMAANSAEVTEAINTIAGISQENGAAVQEVSAAAEEMSAQVSEVAQFANRLNDMTQELHRLMSYFQFDANNGHHPAPALGAVAMPMSENVA